MTTTNKSAGGRFSFNLTSFTPLTSLLVLSLAIDAQASQAELPSLEQAYQIEKARLLADRSALTDEAESLETANRRASAVLESRIASLQTRIQQAQGEADEAERILEQARSADISSSDGTDTISNTLEMARTTLARFGADKGLSDGRLDDAAILSKTLDSAGTLLAELTSTTVSDGSFFDLDGHELTGRIWRIGRHVTIGETNDFARPLRRTGDGSLVSAEGSDTHEIKDFLDSKTSYATLCLAPPDEFMVAHQHQKTFVDVANSGGVIAWIIVGLAVFGLILIVERIVALLVAASGRKKVLAALAKFRKSPDSPVGSLGNGVLGRVISGLVSQAHATREQLEDIAGQAILKELPRLNRLLSLLNVVAVVTPLLGLLGTVTGMISTFEVITEFGNSDPRRLSGGISEALITTEFGLVVAIPTLILHSVLTRWGTRILDETQILVLEWVQVLSSRPKERHDA